MTRSTRMSAMLALPIALTACGRADAPPDETYDGSTMTPTLITDFTPEGPSTTTTTPGMVMVPARGVAVAPNGAMMHNPNGVPTMMATSTETTTRGHRPWADVEVEGMGPMRFTLPYECPYDPIEARVGRRVNVRVDSWKRADGSIRREIVADEIRDSMCGGFRGRDVRRRRADRAQTGTDPVTVAGHVEDGSGSDEIIAEDQD
jgi:hypothetical protein